MSCGDPINAGRGLSELQGFRGEEKDAAIGAVVDRFAPPRGILSAEGDLFTPFQDIFSLPSWSMLQRPSFHGYVQATAGNGACEDHGTGVLADIGGTPTACQ